MESMIGRNARTSLVGDGKFFDQVRVADQIVCCCLFDNQGGWVPLVWLCWTMEMVLLLIGETGEGKEDLRW